MRIIRPCTLADAFAGWGAHEAAGRLRSQLSVVNPDKLASLSILLHWRAPFVARVLLRDPIQTFEVELEPSDAERIVLADTRSLAAWLETTRASGGDSLGYLEALVASTTPPKGPFVAAATRLGSADGEIDDLILYDGWHRLSAWYERIRSDRPSTIEGFLIVVRVGDPLMVKAA